MKKLNKVTVLVLSICMSLVCFPVAINAAVFSEAADGLGVNAVTATPPITEINAEDRDVPVGDSVNVKIGVDPYDAAHDFIYTSADPAIATVEDGKVYGHSIGETVITVTFAENPAVFTTFNVLVYEYEIRANDMSIVAGKNKTVEISISKSFDEDEFDIIDAEVYSEIFFFASSDDSVASIDANGVITAVTTGEATITIATNPETTEGTNISTELTVTVTEPIHITAVEADDITLNVEETVSLTTRTYPDNATNTDLVYVSAEPAIASVDEFGNVIGIDKGTTTITVSSLNNPSVTTDITVTVIRPVRSIINNFPVYTICVGDTINTHAYAVPGNASNPTLIYSTNKERVATVDADGNITGIAPGTAIILVSTTEEHSNVTLKITVNVKIPVTDILVPNAVKLVVTNSGVELPVIDIDAVTSENTYAGGAPSIIPSNATNCRLTYVSKDESIIKVSENGIFKSVAPGVAEVVVTSVDNPRISKTMLVKSSMVLSADIYIPTFMFVNNIKNIVVMPKNDNGLTYVATYHSSNTNVIFIDTSGVVSAVSEGTSTITVTLTFSDGTVIVKDNLVTVNSEPTPTEKSEPTNIFAAFFAKIIAFFKNLFS